jgi:hypothetical protein
MIALLKSPTTVKETGYLNSRATNGGGASGGGVIHTGAGFSYDASRIFRMEAYAHKLRMRALQASQQ